MGNAPSNTAPKQTSTTTNNNDQQKIITDRRNQKRRQSIHALAPTSSKAVPVPPSESLHSAIAQPNQPNVLASPTSSDRGGSIQGGGNQPRVRSNTVATTPQIRPQDAKQNMGNQPSSQQGRATSRTSSLNNTPEPPSAGLVAIPDSRQTSTMLDTAILSPEAYNIGPAGFPRPPRLPLAIDEEVQIPGSPIISPAQAPVDDIPVFDTPPSVTGSTRKNLLSAGAEDEDAEDEEEVADAFATYMMPEYGPNVPKVPTIIEYRDAKTTDKVYVTGTFAEWGKKYRLYWNGPSKRPGVLSATLQLPPGTHHIKFLVNEDMLCASHIPTTVDFTNILVNYIEVSQEPVISTSSTPVPVPTKAMEIRNRTGTSETASPNRPSPRKGVNLTHSPVTSARSSPRPITKADEKVVQPAKHYTTAIPRYLVDIDLWPQPTTDESESTMRYQRAVAAVSTQPAPPSLPLFLTKSILNGTTPLKDDSSVLLLPNHTVLNHLATTNIKQGILATSCTTRYKQKFLTTIMYKPRSEEND